MEDETKNGSEHHHHHHGEGSSGHHHHHSEEHSGHHHHHGDGSTEHHHHHHHHIHVNTAPRDETDAAELIEEIENAATDMTAEETPTEEISPAGESPEEGKEAPAETMPAEKQPENVTGAEKIALGEVTVVSDEDDGTGPATYSRPSVERLRIILMFLMCIDLLGFPTRFGSAVQKICGFVPIAFYVLSGYLVLRPSPHRPERIKRSIKRSAIAFGVLTAVYFVINLLLYLSQGVNIFPVFKEPRFWFNFLFLNVWQFDIGSPIWYVQALLYAYIIIYFLDKFGKMKYDWIISAALILLTVITGELSGVIRWSFLGYTYIPGNFFTRALPYILLGGFIHRKKKVFDGIKKKWYWIAVLCGSAAIILEILFFGLIGRVGYYGHLIGMGVVAVAVVMLAVKGEEGKKPGFEKTLGMSRQYVNVIYYLCHPVSVGLLFVISALASSITTVTAEIVTLFNLLVTGIGIITFAVCLGIAWLASLAGRKISAAKNGDEKKVTE